ncbi:MAG: zinc ribbon domain-containing protein [Candidatus Krumholzibacteria bacterium]|nr:zinc ribbon domain-containing protein [Candidatus Krumholzibacteria bacterium]
MPIFEFVCRDCGLVFEELLTFAQVEAGEAFCPECRSKIVERSLSAFATTSGTGSSVPSCGQRGGGCGAGFG